MKTIAKPYNSSPFTEMVKQKCPWIDDVRERVTKRIEEFERFIDEQAKKDGQPELTNAEQLYSFFKYNKEHNQYYGNLNVMKYFIWQFKVKILHDMIGEWRFTDHDVEMYNYFVEVKIPKAVKVGKFFYAYDKECKSPSMFVHDNTCKWLMVVDGDLEFYSNWFYKEIILLNDMIRNVRGSNLLMPEQRFFDCAVLHEGLNVSKNKDYSDYTDRKFK